MLVNLVGELEKIAHDMGIIVGACIIFKIGFAVVGNLVVGACDCILVGIIVGTILEFLVVITGCCVGAFVISVNGT
jgi:hypothetical protein